MRHYALAEVPFAAWAARHDFAVAMWASARASRGPAAKAVIETILRHRIATLQASAPPPAGSP